MNQKQLDALIEFIEECARYWAQSTDDDEWPISAKHKAENRLRDLCSPAQVPVAPEAK